MVRIFFNYRSITNIQTYGKVSVKQKAFLWQQNERIIAL